MRRFISFSILFLMVQALSYADGLWEKEESHDKWGDVNGFYYVQYAVGEHHAYGELDASTVACVMYSDPAGTLALLEQVSSFMHPGVNLYKNSDKTVEVSVRFDSRKNPHLVATFAEMRGRVLKSPGYNQVCILLPQTCRTLLQTLDEQEVMQLLIEDDDWYTKITLHGGLPHMENEPEVDIFK